MDRELVSRKQRVVKEENEKRMSCRDCVVVARRNKCKLTFLSMRLERIQQDATNSGWCNGNEREDRIDTSRRVTTMSAARLAIVEDDDDDDDDDKNGFPSLELKYPGSGSSKRNGYFARLLKASHDVRV